MCVSVCYYRNRMPQTLADWLIQHFPTAKRQTLRRMVEAGRVRINGQVAKRYSAALADGDQVVVAKSAEAPSPQRPPARRALQLAIVFEDADLLIVNKPAGLLTSTVPREKRPTLLAMVREYLADDRQARVGLIHRLDRDAAGLLVFSKSDLAYQSLKTQFFHHTVERVYHALVRGSPQPPAGRIESHLIERADGTVHTTRQIGKGQLAITRYETVRSANGRSLVRVTLETGRKHQIRVHLQEKGCTIVGDRVYGPRDAKDNDGNLMLIATRLGFKHPRTGESVVYELPIAEEMKAMMPDA
jgi:23S rRNA pseudouridine1911/1915/1917 synthase